MQYSMLLTLREVWRALHNPAVSDVHNKEPGAEGDLDSLFAAASGTKPDRAPSRPAAAATSLLQSRDTVADAEVNQRGRRAWEWRRVC